MTTHRAILVGLLLATPACTGYLEGDDRLAAATPPGSAGESSSSTAAGYAPLAVPRLTRAQYVHSVRDLLGETAGAAAEKLELADPVSENDHTYRSMRAASNGLVDIAAEHVSRTAFDIARAATSDASGRTQWLGCSPQTPGDSCVTSGMSALLQRAYRRPLSAQELGRYSSLIDKATTQQAGDVWRGIEAGLAALLQSPHFVFAPNLGEPDPGRPGRVRYSGPEMAGRLALLLWSSVPDAPLQAAAADGRLLSAAGIRDQAERLLADPRARRGVMAFGSDLLETDRLSDLAKDAQSFPSFNAELGQAMRSEIEEAFAAAVVDHDADFVSLLTTRNTFVNDQLATLYGLPATGGAGMRAVTLPADSPRAGLLGMAGFLAVHAGPSEGSIIKRGVFINERLLCREFGMPPADAAMNGVASDQTGARTLRERTVASTSSAACAGCHAQINPLGFGLERFDGIGALRETDHGAPIDASGDLNGVPFGDEPALAEALSQSEDAQRCIVKQLYRYATGHKEQPAEAEHLMKLEERFLTDGRQLRSLLVELTASDGFRYAEPSEAP